MPLFQAGDAQVLPNDLLLEFEKADLLIVNLECPLIRKEKPIEKVVPNFGSPEACIKGFKAIGIDVVELANKHIRTTERWALKTQSVAANYRVYSI